MKIVIAPDSYKESLSAPDVARAIRDGFSEVFAQAEYVLLPMADGGEGTVEALMAATAGHIERHTVTGPMGTPVSAFWGLTGDRTTAVIEMAAASGLEQVPADRRNPLVATSYGTGELISKALESGARYLIIGIGGSATNDGGAGMLQALGVRLMDRRGRPIGFGGQALADLDRMDVSGLDGRVLQARIDVACDVDNPLVGEQGASAVFGPQKGAGPEDVALLDAALAHFAAIVERDLGIHVADTPGGGAAGGMGAALVAFCGARLRPGIEVVMEMVGLDEAIRDADLVITGEGRIDSQSIRGKTPVGVARIARRYGKPVIGIAGSLGDGVEMVYNAGLDAVFSVLHNVGTLEQALANAAPNIRLGSRNIAAAWRAGIQLRQPDTATREVAAQRQERVP